MVIELYTAESASSAEEPLHSDKFTQCHCIIVQNAHSGEALMLHVWDGAHDGLNAEQKEAAQAFAGNIGTKHAVVIEGSRSEIGGNAQEYLEALGITFRDGIDLKTGDGEWEVTFDPRTRQATITAGGTPIYRESLFPVRTPVASPAESSLER